ncbi:MAG: hypothetical protein PHS33_09125 [Candidatus Omnitrophica bacterium]|nr:hypothetical protein [Candidatus Omnitrophota bacterium]
MPQIEAPGSSSDLPIVEKQNYSAMVLVCQYKGATDTTHPEDATAYEDFFYEINRGLTSIVTSYQINGQGSGSITIILPVDKSFESIKNLFDKVLKKWDNDAIKYNWAKIDPTTKLYQSTNSTYTVPGNIIQESNVDQKKITNTNIFGESIPYYPILDDTKTQCVFKPMDKVRIYEEGRFSKALFKVCEGLIQSASVSFDGVGITVNIQLTDLTKWLDISEYNINPALAMNVVAPRTGQQDVSVFTTNLSNLTPQEIVKKMVVGDTDKSKNLTYREKYNELLTTKAKDYLVVDIVVTDNTGGIIESMSRMDYSKNATGEAPSLEQIDQEVEYIQSIMTPTDTVTVNYYIMMAGVRGCGYFSLSPVNGNIENGQFTEIMQNTAFDKDTLWIDPNLFTLSPYVREFGQFDLWNHQYQKRYQICMEVANRIEGEFFANPDGRLILKMPYYNYNPGTVWGLKKYKDNGDLDENSLGEPYMPNGDFYLIEEKDILNYTFSEDDSNIVNFIWVTGQPEWGMQVSDLPVGVSRTYLYDAPLIKRFGMRETTINIPFAAWEQDEEKRKTFGQAYMNKRNANYRKGSMTIPLRPEIQIGNTIAILNNQISKQLRFGNAYRGYKQYSESSIFYGKSLSRFIEYMVQNKKSGASLSNIPVYYIQGLTHTWNVGGQCTTSLQLTYGRYWEKQFEFNLFDPKKYIEVADQSLIPIFSLISSAESKINAVSKQYSNAADESLDTTSDGQAQNTILFSVKRNLEICEYATIILEQLQKLFITYVNTSTNYIDVQSGVLLQKKFKFKDEIIAAINPALFDNFDWLKTKYNNDALLYPLQQSLISIIYLNGKLIQPDVLQPLMVETIPLSSGF